MARTKSAATSEQVVDSNIIIPEEFDKRQGVRPDWFGQVENVPPDKVIVWARNSAYDQGQSFTKYLPRGYRPVTESEFKELGLRIPGGYYEVDKERGWVLNGDTVLLMADITAKLAVYSERNRKNKIIEQQLKEPSSGGAQMSHEDFEGNLKEGLEIAATR